MTRRFDRTAALGKLHMQSLCAVAHYDFNDPGAYSYEHAFQVMRELRLPHTDAEQLFSRMVFNVVARNQDDHTKNISFLMDKSGTWCLAPAYDVIYAYNPAGQWTSRHQMSINGKREDITRSDFRAVGRAMNIKRVDRIVDRVVDAVSRWGEFAEDAGVSSEQTGAIGRAHQLR
jgi:serine/threonine-protein kinase HipA